MLPRRERINMSLLRLHQSFTYIFLTSLLFHCHPAATGNSAESCLSRIDPLSCILRRLPTYCTLRSVISYYFVTCGFGVPFAHNQSHKINTIFSGHYTEMIFFFEQYRWANLLSARRRITNWDNSKVDNNKESCGEQTGPSAPPPSLQPSYAVLMIIIQPELKRRVS